MSDWSTLGNFLVNAAEKAKKASKALESSFDAAVKDNPPLYDNSGNILSINQIEY